MLLRIQESGEKKLAGLKQIMSLTDNHTAALFASFMQEFSKRRVEFPNVIYSLQVYPGDYFMSFNPEKNFEKWALTEWPPDQDLPEGWQRFNLPAGNYAVFLHRGDRAAFAKTMQYILTEWLPGSGYKLDERPHFEILGSKYRNNDPESEEEVWIPVLTAR